MGQIVTANAKPKRCNLSALRNTTSGHLGSTTPANGEIILVSSDNSMDENGVGNFDCYVEGDGTSLASVLELKHIDGGIAEDIGYSNSTSALNANNVQDAIDTLSEETLFMTNIPIESLGSIKGYAILDNGKWTSKSSYYYTLFEVNAGDVVGFKGNSSSATYYAFLNTASPSNGVVADFAPNTTIYTLQLSEEKRVVIPNGTSYLYFAITLNSDRTPQWLHTYKHNIQDEITEALTSVDALGSETKIESFSFTEYNYGTLNTGYIKYTDGSLNAGNNYRYTNLIPVSVGQMIETQLYMGDSSCVVAAYSDSEGTYIKDASINGNNTLRSIKYWVPEGVVYIRLCFNFNATPHFYIKIHDKGKINEYVLGVNEEIKDIESSISVPIEHIKTYAGKYFNGSTSTIASALCRQYKIDTYPRVYVSTEWLSAQGGYFAVVFTDQSNNVLSLDYVCQANETLSLDKVVINVPTDAYYLYVNSRYNDDMPKVYVDATGDSINECVKRGVKEISILFIGNSLTQDAVSYVPLLMKDLAPNISFKFYVWYHGGYTLSQFLSDIENNANAEIFSVCENEIGWTNYTNSVTMASVLDTYKFDMVCMQEYFNYQDSPNIEAFNSIIEYIEDNYGYPFKVVSLFHQPKRDGATTIFNNTKAGNIAILKNTVSEDIIPSGIATYRAMSTALDSLGDNGHLSPDGTHSQEGLPCMLQAYVTALWIFDKLGFQMSVNNCSSIVTTSNYDSINVPGANLGTGVVVGTTEQVRLSQSVAIKAFKEGKHIVDMNLYD